MSLFTPEFGLAFWMLIIFLILLFVLAKFAWPAIIKSMDERADFIDKGVEYAKEAKEDRENAKQEAQVVVSDAYQEQLKVLRQTERMKQEIIDEARKEANQKSDRMIRDAHLAIEQAEREAMIRLRKRVGELAVQIAEKVVRQHLSDDKAQLELVDKLLDDMENKE